MDVRRDALQQPRPERRPQKRLFLAQGYLHAQERLWQMDSTRRFLCGRLAEILGDRTVPGGELSVRFRDKSSVEMDPMSSYERMIVHTELKTFPHIKTESAGEGRGRHIVVKYVG